MREQVSCLVDNGARCFQTKGQFQDGSFVPAAGDIIFFDWKNEVKRERYFRKKKYQKKCIPDDIIITVIKIEIDLEI